MEQNSANNLKEPRNKFPLEHLARDLFKTIGDTKGTFLAKMGTIKDRNCVDLTEEIKKRWEEYTELYKKKSS